MALGLLHWVGVFHPESFMRQAWLLKLLNWKAKGVFQEANNLRHYQSTHNKMMNEKDYDEPEKAERLFPTPSPPPTVLCSQRWPGCNLESLTAVRHALFDNHTRYHIFRNYIKFHKRERPRNSSIVQAHDSEMPLYHPTQS
ncbi:uncharacterized protein F5147DRAFT_74081 [Suillus discolor]|uniref:Uncharacterized protein n=1 Tax=Suillus discolor TaxID=1912936 RepID=A0A9P7JWL8_9AGAM|nr:uncharacterized protein F5147DRAFT_74081 [Suillus discolor]KAG2112668.1 hypothetical protein F5147DRAFT_74081 [Suillus discolor]